MSYENGSIGGNGNVQEKAQELTCFHEGLYERIRIPTGAITALCPKCVENTEAYHRQIGSTIERLGPI